MNSTTVPCISKMQSILRPLVSWCVGSGIGSSATHSSRKCKWRWIADGGVGPLDTTCSSRDNCGSSQWVCPSDRWTEASGGEGHTEGVTKYLLMFEVSGMHETSQEEMVENKNGSTTELGWPSYPSLIGIFWVLEQKSHIAENSSVQGKLKPTVQDK